MFLPPVSVTASLSISGLASGWLLAVTEAPQDSVPVPDQLASRRVRTPDHAAGVTLARPATTGTDVECLAAAAAGSCCSLSGWPPGGLAAWAPLSLADSVMIIRLKESKYSDLDHDRFRVCPGQRL